MAGTIEGGRKAAEKNLKSDPNFYKRIGAKGGATGVGPEYQKGGSKPSGFAANPELARIAGALGGRISRKPKRVEDSLSLQN